MLLETRLIIESTFELEEEDPVVEDLGRGRIGRETRKGETAESERSDDSWTSESPCCSSSLSE